MFTKECIYRFQPYYPQLPKSEINVDWNIRIHKTTLKDSNYHFH